MTHESSPPTLPVGAPVASMPLRRPARADMRGGGVLLRPLDAARDAEELFRISHGSPGREAIWTYMGYGPFAHVTAMAGWLTEIQQGDDPLFFTVFSTVDPATGAPAPAPLTAGLVSFLNIEPAHRRLELGHIWYGLDYQRTHVNTATIYLMLRHTFEELHFRRAEWKCDSLNARSRAAALRLGFREEGLFRQHIVYKGRNRDTAWFSMLDSEWPTAKVGLQAHIRTTIDTPS